MVPLMDAIKPYKCLICEKAFDDSSIAKQHVRARKGDCFRRDVAVLHRHAAIRASDRVVGGRKRVEDFVSCRFPPVQDHGPYGDDEPINEAEPAGDDDTTVSVNNKQDS